MYQIKRINDDEYPQIKKLYQISFGVSEPLSFFKWKYNTLFFGAKNIGVIAETNQQEPAAYYGVFPMILTYQSKDYLVAQSGDTMTAPDHRNKGLFVKLAKLTYQLAAEDGVKLVFGFPNKNSYPGFVKKLDWVFNGEMQKFTINNFTIPFCELTSKWKFLEPIYRRYARLKLRRYQIEPNEININCFSENTSTGIIKKDILFFNYKLANKDNYLISFQGFTLLIKARGHLILGAVGYFDKERTNQFINTVGALGNKLGCRKTIIILSLNQWLTNYLMERMEPQESYPIGFYKFNDIFDTSSIEFVNADFDTF